MRARGAASSARRVDGSRKMNGVRWGGILSMPDLRGQSAEGAKRHFLGREAPPTVPGAVRSPRSRRYGFRQPSLRRAPEA